MGSGCKSASRAFHDPAGTLAPQSPALQEGAWPALSPARSTSMEDPWELYREPGQLCSRSLEASLRAAAQLAERRLRGMLRVDSLSEL